MFREQQLNLLFLLGFILIAPSASALDRPVKRERAGAQLRSITLTEACVAGRRGSCPASSQRVSALIDCKLDDSLRGRAAEKGIRLNDFLVLTSHDVATKSQVTTAEMPVRALARLRQICPSASAGAGMQPLGDVAMRAIGANQIWGGWYPNISTPGYTGSNVIVGVVDTGLDVLHDDFKHSDGSTRVLRYWDQTISRQPAPAGFTYGSEFTDLMIDSGILPDTDNQSHGTHIAGTAASDGSATGNGKPAFTYVGAAPESDLVVVKLYAYLSGRYPDSRVIDGVRYVFDKARELNRPAVVLLAIGSKYGPKDGSGAFEQAITALTGPGKIVVAAAGNDYGQSLHAEANFSALNEVKDITINISAYSPTATDAIVIEGWYNHGATFDVSIIAPSGTIVGPVSTGNQISPAIQSGAGLVELRNGISAERSSNLSNRFYSQIFRGSLSYPAVVAGTWTIRIKNTSPSGNHTFDTWIVDQNISSKPVFVTGKTEAKLVQSPATADSVISVGSYTTKRSWVDITGAGRSYYYAVLGQIAHSSASGPRRDGVLAPFIAAPGFGIVASLSQSSASWVSSANVVQDGVHFMNSGTSVAAATVAGSVALLLQQYGNLTTEQVKSLLQNRVLPSDSSTGGLPNNRWGYGKFFMGAQSPTVSPTPSPTPTASLTPTPTASATPSPTATATKTPTPSVTPTPSPTPTASLTPTPTASATPSPTPTKTPTPSLTPTPSPTPTASLTPTPTASATPSPSPTLAQDVLAPSAPTMLGATLLPKSKVKLSWAASTDNVAVTGYQIIRNNKLRATVGAGALTFTDTGLRKTTVYTFVVKALDAAGNISAPSNQVIVGAQTSSTQIRKITVRKVRKSAPKPTSIQ